LFALHYPEHDKLRKDPKISEDFGENRQALIGDVNPTTLYSLQDSAKGHLFMQKLPVLVFAFLTISLSGCIAVKAVGTTARVAGSAVVTAVDVTGSAVGGAARTVTGGRDDEAD
jgi:hypothetical protein